MFSFENRWDHPYSKISFKEFSMAMFKNNEEINALKARIKKLQHQQKILLKKLDQKEGPYKKKDGIYKKYLPYVIGLARDEASPLSTILDDLSSALKEQKKPEEIETVFKELKEALEAEEADQESEDKKPVSLWSSLLNPECSEAYGTSDGMDESRQSYFDITDRLAKIIDPDYMNTLNRISSRIDAASDAWDMDTIRDDLFRLAENYITDINAEHEKISAFIRQLVKRMLLIESGIAGSFQTGGDSEKLNLIFNSILDKEFNELKGSISVSQELDGLKSKMTGTLSTIEDTLKKKKKKELALKSISEKNRQAILTGFATLKKELNKATRHSKKLEIELNQDPLTGAFNRRAYDRSIENEFRRFLKYGTVFSLLVIDADHFKKVNDTYGHGVGDKCLQEIINRTVPKLRQTDILARYGGEEFAVIMPETKGQGAMAVAERIRQAIEKTAFIHKEDTVKLTVSIGAAEVHGKDTTHTDLFNRADTAVYQAKEAGRNRIVLKKSP